MNFIKKRDIKFTEYYKKLNVVSFVFIILSISILIYKGLNLCVDFKGGTLIELRTQSDQIQISEIRKSFINNKLEEMDGWALGIYITLLIQIDKK